MPPFLEKTVNIRLSQILSVVTLVVSLAIAAGGYKASFDNSISEIKNLSGEMKLLRESVIRLEERLGALERYK